MTNVFEYHWLHVPTGERGKRTTYLTGTRDGARFALLERLNEYNQQQQGKWVYWL